MKISQYSTKMISFTMRVHFCKKFQNGGVAGRKILKIEMKILKIRFFRAKNRKTRIT